MILQQIIKVIQVTKATQRIPQPQRRRVTYFSENDVWLFQAHSDTKVCPKCRMYEEMEQIRGNHLRIEFPYLTIIDENTIGGQEPDGGGLVHPNCRCLLVRLLEEHEEV